MHIEDCWFSVEEIATHVGVNRDPPVPSLWRADTVYLRIKKKVMLGRKVDLTWNFRHINNAETKCTLTAAVEAAGYKCPMICSPKELMGR
jgi:hypothetical protein